MFLAPLAHSSCPEDELQNVNMVDDEVLRAAKERKRKAQETYTGYDDEEFDEDRIGRRADVLGKYDDSFISGKAKQEVSPFFLRLGHPLTTQGFRLGAAIEKKIVKDEDVEMIGAPASRVKLNLDYTSASLLPRRSTSLMSGRRIRGIGLPERGRRGLQTSEEEEV